MTETGRIVYCEMCGRRVIEGACIELPQDMIAKVELEELGAAIEDPSVLRFCTDRCREKWGKLKRAAVLKKHGTDCYCPECLG